MQNLTPKQAIVLEYIEAYQLEHGKSPTLRELREHLGVSSDNSVLKHLAALEKKGYIQKDDTPRGIGLLESVRRRLESVTFQLPILGFIPAGGPVSAQEYTDGYITVPTSLVTNPSGCFALKVTGQSMIDAGIYEGDLLIADSNKAPKVGDVVIALVDNENTVKRLVSREGRYYLKAENSSYSDIEPIESLQIQGVVVSLHRRFY